MLKDSFNNLSAQNIIPSYFPNSVSWTFYPKYTINLNNSKTTFQTQINNIYF